MMKKNESMIVRERERAEKMGVALLTVLWLSQTPKRLYSP